MGTTVVIIVSIVILVLVMVNMNNNARQRNEALNEARYKYQAALKKLKEKPTDPARREAALSAGRAYSALTRDNKSVTVFDELALKNDLDAATAGAVAVAPVPVAAPAPSAPAASVEDRLRRLEELKGKGLVTDAEYADRRAKILDEM